MRSGEILLSLVLLMLPGLGCWSTPPGVPPPDATSAGATAREPAPTAAVREVLAAPAAEVAPGVAGLPAECEAGSAQACLRLCTAESAVCVADDDGDRCKEQQDRKAASVEPCAVGGDLEPGKLCTLTPSEVSPTQGAVGMFAVDCKSSKLEGEGKKKLRRYLLARPVPLVVGPGGSYITDRHHLSAALFKSAIDEERKRLFVCPLAVRGADDPATFWYYMKANQFVWLQDRQGRPIEPADLPRDLAALADDPYRTLSRWVRDSCGYIKCGKVCGGDDSGGERTAELPSCKANPVTASFLEFRWADYLREQVSLPNIYALPLADQGAALRDSLPRAMAAVRASDAIERDLPGRNDGLIEPTPVNFDSAGCED